MLVDTEGAFHVAMQINTSVPNALDLWLEFDLLYNSLGLNESSPEFDTLLICQHPIHALHASFINGRVSSDFIPISEEQTFKFFEELYFSSGLRLDDLPDISTDILTLARYFPALC
jgi:hypothetical protein